MLIITTLRTKHCCKRNAGHSTCTSVLFFPLYRRGCWGSEQLEWRHLRWPCQISLKGLCPEPLLFDSMRLRQVLRPLTRPGFPRSYGGSGFTVLSSRQLTPTQQAGRGEGTQAAGVQWFVQSGGMHWHHLASPLHSIFFLNWFAEKNWHFH